MASPRQVVLIVEDNALVRLDMAENLSSSGWSVLEADSAQEALDLCDSGERVDVLVTDIDLGNGSTGWDVARAFWQRDPIPVIYTSGNFDSPQRHVPHSAFMTKPCRPLELVEACQRLHTRHRDDI
jgi:CheY-like chemotaxis protein